MKNIKKLILITSLIPLLIVLIASLLNLSSQTKIRLLTWKSPDVPLGYLLIIGFASSFSLGFASHAPLNNNFLRLNRKVKTSYGTTPNEKQNLYPNEDINSWTLSNNEDQHMNESGKNNYSSIFPPERSIRDPSPTMTTSYRVINKQKKGKNHNYQSNENIVSNLDYNDPNGISNDDTWQNDVDDNW